MENPKKSELNKAEEEMDDWISSAGRSAWVSVIIPTYNRSGFLDRAIQSVFDQTYRPIECIVVDDGSTDNTPELLKKWDDRSQSKFIFCHYRQSNSGAPSARNHGTWESVGEYIQYLDSDDLLYPEKLEEQVNILRNSRDIDGIYGDWEMGFPEQNETVRASKDGDLILQFLGKRCVHTLSFLMRRSLVQKIGPWDTNLKRNQEIDFHLRGVLAGGRFEYREMTCGLWRLHEGDRVSTESGKQGVYTFFRKWVNLLESSEELTPERRHAISDGLFHSAMSGDLGDRRLISDMLSLSWELCPERSEFKTPKMRLAQRVLGKELAMNMWLWRATNLKRGELRS